MGVEAAVARLARLAPSWDGAPSRFHPREGRIKWEVYPICGSSVGMRLRQQIPCHRRPLAVLVRVKPTPKYMLFHTSTKAWAVVDHLSERGYRARI